MPIDTVNVNNKARTQNTYDAIVIGSGISGGWAAKELTERARLEKQLCWSGAAISSI